MTHHIPGSGQIITFEVFVVNWDVFVVNVDDFVNPQIDVDINVGDFINPRIDSVIDGDEKVFPWL
jgi:hypothetical protein